MKRLAILLFLAGLVVADYPKPTFTVNAYHFDRLHVAHEFEVVLPLDILLSEQDKELFYIDLRHNDSGWIWRASRHLTSNQFCARTAFDPLYARPPATACGSQVELPHQFYAEVIATVSITPTKYDEVDIFQLVLVLPDIGYEEVLSELTVDSYYNYTGGMCGDGLHPYPIGDINKDCIVNLADLAIIALNWMKCTFDCE